jgi:hypothetical protein
MKILTEKQIEEIRKNPNEQNWCDISCNYKLSEPFIREFKDVIWWVWISEYQILSEPFIYEFIDMIVLYQKHLSIETRNKIELIHKLQNNQEN